MKQFLMTTLLFCLSVNPLISQAQASPDFDNMTSLDLFAMELEKARLLDAAGIVRLPNGYIDHAFKQISHFLTANPLWSPKDIEIALRKWNTSLHLLAAPEKFKSGVEGMKACIAPLTTIHDSLSHFLWLVVGPPQAVKESISDYPDFEEGTNLKQLETVGKLSTHCPEAI